MTYPHIDTDVLIRWLTGDDPKKAQAVAALFAQVESGSLDLYCPVPVIADTIYVLSSPDLYHQSRETVSSALLRVVGLPHFHVADRRIVAHAIGLFGTTTLDFGDCLIVASMEAHHETRLYSYDRHFNRFPSITRVEP